MGSGSGRRSSHETPPKTAMSRVTSRVRRLVAMRGLWWKRWKRRVGYERGERSSRPVAKTVETVGGGARRPFTGRDLTGARFVLKFVRWCKEDENGAA